jgi:hypothetical protein
MPIPVSNQSINQIEDAPLDAEDCVKLAFNHFGIKDFFRVIYT